MFLSKYGVARHIYIPVIKRGVVDFAVGADWTPAAGDVKVAINGASPTNIGTLPSAVTSGQGAFWDFTLTTGEMSGAQIIVTVADSATKAVEDQSFIIETYGHASAQHQIDFADSVRAGLTALPNAAAAASGGLPTVDAFNSVKIQGRVKKSTALTNFMILMTDSVNHNPLTGKGTSVAVTRSLDGGSFSTGTLGATAEVANGWYKFDFGSGDLAANTIVLRATVSGADDTFVVLNTFD